MTAVIVAKKNLDSVKIDSEIVRAAKLIAAWRGESLQEYFARNMLPIVQHDRAVMARELSREAGGEAFIPEPAPAPKRKGKAKEEGGGE